MITTLRFTIDDLEQMPDKPGVRYEIIDGELYVSTAPHPFHGLVCAQTALALGDWNRQTQLGWTLVGSGVVFAPDDAVIPDIIWFNRDRLPHPSTVEKIRSAPDLVVEILSPGRANEFRDREVKRDLYERRGVGEYWLLDWQARLIEVHRREDGALRLAATLTAADTLTSPALPGFACRVSDLFAMAS